MPLSAIGLDFGTVSTVTECGKQNGQYIVFYVSTLKFVFCAEKPQCIQLNTYT